MKYSSAKLASVLKANWFGVAFIAQFLMVLWACQSSSWALGLVNAQPIRPVHSHLIVTKGRRGVAQNFTEIRFLLGGKGKLNAHLHADRDKRTAWKKRASQMIFLPQNYISHLKSIDIAPGVVYKSFKGPLTINVLDIDTKESPVRIHPILANGTFNSLEDIAKQANDSHALAAMNANYFKKNGTPLGTLIIDGEWVAGPIYDRVSLGVTKSGSILVDRVKLAGELETSNTEVPNIWINNVNQPRRTGSRLVAYTRRWGGNVRLPYEGCLVAIDAAGKVIDKNTLALEIPVGGYVLIDSKGGAVSKLVIGDLTKLSWHAKPDNWDEVEQAVSGGPLLIKNGKLFVDLKDEKFRSAWTGGQIRARTAAGVTACQHLLLVTVEGPHTLWDLAKFLHGMGAVDALNLDGGGSTAMFVGGETVTKSKRKVASAIGIFAADVFASSDQNSVCSYMPRLGDLCSFTQADRLTPMPQPTPSNL